MAQRLKRLPPMQETRVRSLGQEDSPEKEMATHSSILAGESHGRRSLVGCSPRGCKESDTTKRLHFHFQPVFRGLPRWLSGKESTCQCRRRRFNPWVRKIPWRRKWQPTPVFLPGKSHGQSSLAGYSPRGHKESDMTQ